MSLLINDPSSNTTTLDIITDKENLTCISKFRLFLSVSQYINLRPIFYTIPINNLTIMLDKEFNF